MTALLRDPFQYCSVASLHGHEGLANFHATTRIMSSTTRPPRSHEDDDRNAVDFLYHISIYTVNDELD
jgi:hypothetical protein